MFIGCSVAVGVGVIDGGKVDVGWGVLLVDSVLVGFRVWLGTAEVVGGRVGCGEIEVLSPIGLHPMTIRKRISPRDSLERVLNCI